MEVNGKIKVLGNVQQVSETFKKREVVITTDEQYPQHILIEFKQDKCNILDNYKVGDTVKVSINLGGREWVNPQGETKYFNSVQGWFIKKQEVANQTPIPAIPQEPFAPATNFKEEEHDDLPF